MGKKRGRSRKKNKGLFKTISIVISIFFAIQIAMAVTNGEIYNISRSMAERMVHNTLNLHDKEFPRNLIITSILNIYHEYDQNQVAANRKYKDNSVAIVGTVKSVHADANSQAIVNLKVPFTLGSFVAARGDSLFTEKSADLIPGQQIVMVCTGNGIDLDTLLMSDCKLYGRP